MLFSTIKWRTPAVCAAACALAFADTDAAEMQNTEGKKAETSAMKIAVLDFTCIDLAGQKLRLVRSRPVNTDYRGILSSADRQSIDDRMQGFVRMLDARFAGEENIEFETAPSRHRSRIYDRLSRRISGNLFPCKPGGD